MFSRPAVSPSFALKLNILCLLCATLLALSQPLRAQAQAGISDYDVATKAYAALVRELGGLDKAEPLAGAARLRRFLDENPRLHAGVGNGIYGDMAALHLRAPDQEKGFNSAIETLAEGARRYKSVPGSASHLYGRAELLTKAGRAIEAEKTVRESLPHYRQWGPITYLPLFRSLVSALEAQGKGTAAIALIKQEFIETPHLLDDEASGSVWLWDRLIGGLLEMGREDEALQWGRLRFAVCSFGEEPIGRAMGTLVKAWTLKTFSQASTQAFLEAQKTAGAPNPLSEVKLPVIEEEQQKVMLARASEAEGSAQQRTHGRISALIALGRFREAMGAARLMLVAEEGASAGIQEVARVFKAADASVLRGNRFIEFFQSAQGDNPLEEFFEQYPAPPEPVPAE